MIKAVIFDYGGVVTAGGNGHDVTDRLGKILGVSGTEAFRFLDPFWQHHFTGKVSEEILWANIEKASGKQIAEANRHIWNTWEQMQPIQSMLDLVQSLKNRSIIVGVLSNAMPSTEQDITAHGGYDIFDFAILSNKVGYAKPDLEIYKLALRQLPGVLPQEVVFIDDQERCLTPARELGIQTILAQSPLQISNDLLHIIGNKATDTYAQ